MVELISDNVLASVYYVVVFILLVLLARNCIKSGKRGLELYKHFLCKFSIFIVILGILTGAYGIISSGELFANMPNGNDATGFGQVLEFFVIMGIIVLMLAAATAYIIAGGVLLTIMWLIYAILVYVKNKRNRDK